MFLCAGYGISLVAKSPIHQKEIRWGIIRPMYNLNPCHGCLYPRVHVHIKMRNHAKVQNRTIWLHIKKKERKQTCQNLGVCHGLDADLSNFLHPSASFNAWSNKETQIERAPKSSFWCTVNVSFSPFNYTIFIMRPSSLSQLLKWKASLWVPQLHYAGLYLCWQHALLLTSYCLLLGRRSLPCISNWKLKEN